MGKVPIYQGFEAGANFRYLPLNSLIVHNAWKTRNAVWGNSPGVRIPNSPPMKAPGRVLRGLLYHKEGNTAKVDECNTRMQQLCGERGRRRCAEIS